MKNYPGILRKNRTLMAHRFASLCLVTAGVAMVQQLSMRELQAQSFVRRTVVAGNISGLELAIEGPVRGYRGGRIQWQLAAQQVTGLSELHVAPRTRIRVLCSLVRDRAMAEVTTDEMGRVEAGFVIPEDAPEQFHVVFEAISTNNIRRQYDLDIHADSPRTLTLHVDRQHVRPGGQVNGFARLISNLDGRAIANEPVSFTFTENNGRPVATRFEGRTDANGTIAHSFNVPSGRSARYTLSVSHNTEFGNYNAGRSVESTIPSVPVMIVRAMPVQSMVEPASTVRMMISVRTSDGRPVHNAIVYSSKIPRTLLTPRNERPSVRTGANGIAMFEFEAPRSGGTPIDLPIDVQATRPGLGDANTVASVRLARATLHGGAAVEGGYLTQGLAGRIYARVVRADGSPAGAGVNVALTGPRFGRGAQATTDADGVATLDVTLGSPVVARPARRPPTRTADGEATDDGEGEEETPLDACGGTTATGFSLVFTEGTRRGSSEGCIGIEPDATIRPRVREGAVVAPNTDLHVTLQRLPIVARVPVQVALTARDGGNYAPIAGVIVGPNATEATIHVPPHVSGQLIVRARALWGSLSQPVLGGSTAVWVQRGQRVPLTVQEASGSTVQVNLGTASALPLSVTVVPREDATQLLSEISEADQSRVLGDLRVPFAQAGNALLSGAMFARMLRDHSVQGVLRGNHVVDLPAPSDPAEWGNLRDPYRSSARFVEGRLALIFQSIEGHVATKIRTHRADVGQRVGNHWEFNREIFDALMQSADGADSSGGARNLGGGPLTIQDLQRLDPAFTFDNVARRLTRKRMFVLLVALRQFSAQRALDLRWSWRGDPTAWLRQMSANEGEFSIEDAEGNSTTIDADAMVDGWGNLFALRPAPGGRNRFGFLQPVPGFDLVSAGPDGAMGTGDDIVDPFARVLPSGGAYARAMNEDGLVARLRGVELGRATIARLLGVFEASSAYEDGEEEGGSEQGQAGPDWTSLPSKLTPDPFALSLLRPASTAASFVRHGTTLNNGGSISLTLDDEPRVWTAVVHGYNADGTFAYNSRSFSAGKPVLITLPLAPRTDELRPTLPRVRVGEVLDVVANVTNLSTTDHQYNIVATGEGSIQVQAPATVAVPAGQSAAVPLRISGTRAGAGAVQLEVRDETRALMRQVRAPLIADLGGVSLRQDAMGLTHNGTLTLSESVPSNIRGASERLVLLAPNALSDDPELDRVRRTDPALIAWAYTLAGRTVPTALADAVLNAAQISGAVSNSEPGRSAQSSPTLSTACALVAWAAADENDSASHAALNRARYLLANMMGSGFSDTDSTAGQLRLMAATVAALATGAPSMDGAEGSDPIEQYVANARSRMHAAREAYTAQPTILARVAAALLLMDPTDSRARSMYERAKRAVVDSGARGALVGAGEGRARMEEVLAASAAMAIAAQQRGDLALAHSLARGVALRGHLAMRAGGEVAFWLLANASFGVLGVENPTQATVSINGQSREIILENGRALLPITGQSATTRTVTVTTPGQVPLIARWELTYDTPTLARNDAPVTLQINGDPGFSGERAALELSVQNTETTPLQRLVIELQLPAGTGLGEELLRAMQSNGNLANVELRDGALLRVVIANLTARQTVTVPLPLRWLSQGTISGLGTVAYLEDRPTRMTVLAPREIVLRERPSEQVPLVTGNGQPTR